MLYFYEKKKKQYQGKIKKNFTIFQWYETAKAFYGFYRGWQSAILGQRKTMRCPKIVDYR